MNRYMLLAFCLMSFIGCARQTPEHIFSQALRVQQELSWRYTPVFSQSDKDMALSELRNISSHYSLSFGSMLWNDILGNDHLTRTESAPLHKAVYMLESDIQEIDAMLQKLERYGFFQNSMYTNLVTIKRELLSLMRLVKGQPEYVTESQYIETRRMQKAQLHEQREQTELLRDMRNQSRPSKQETTIIVNKYNIYE